MHLFPVPLLPNNPSTNGLKHLGYGYRTKLPEANTRIIGGEVTPLSSNVVTEASIYNNNFDSILPI